MSDLDLPTSISIGNEYTLYAAIRRCTEKKRSDTIVDFICNEVLHSNAYYSSSDSGDVNIVTKKGVYNFYDSNHDVFKFSGRKLKISEEFASKCYYMDTNSEEFKARYSTYKEFEEYIAKFIRKELNISNDYVFLDKSGYITDINLGRTLANSKNAEKYSTFYIVKLDSKNIEFDTDKSYNKEPFLKTLNSITVYKQLYSESIKRFCKKYNANFSTFSSTRDILMPVNNNICFGTLRLNYEYNYDLNSTFDDMMKKLVNKFAESLLANMYDGQFLSDLEELCCNKQSIIDNLSENIIKAIDKGINNIKIDGIK